MTDNRDQLNILAPLETKPKLDAAPPRRSSARPAIRCRAAPPSGSAG